jgi:hypothetical protein
VNTASWLAVSASAPQFKIFIKTATKNCSQNFAGAAKSLKNQQVMPIFIGARQISL